MADPPYTHMIALSWATSQSTSDTEGFWYAMLCSKATVLQSSVHSSRKNAISFVRFLLLTHSAATDGDTIVLAFDFADSRALITEYLSDIEIFVWRSSMSAGAPATCMSFPVASACWTPMPSSQHLTKRRQPDRRYR